MARFYAIDQASFIAACNLGINPACAYLTIACGTGRKNDSSRWSSKAVATRLAMRWESAKDSISSLISGGLMSNIGTTARPIYRITTAAERGEQSEEDAQRIWLPNTIVMGAAEEVPPILKLRQTQDVMTLRLFVELYLAQNLLEDGGVSTKVYYQAYRRERIGAWKQYAVFGFSRECGYVAWGDAAKPHRRDQLTDEEKTEGKNAGVDFFDRLSRLKKLGLVEEIAYLYDGPKGEPIIPMSGDGSSPTEYQLWSSAVEAASLMVTDGQRQYAERMGHELLPVLSHIEQATLIGVLRMRYRPQTKLTATWFAKREESCLEMQAIFDSHINALKGPSLKVAGGGFI